ncbi:putative Beat-va [Daphnia magna]|uniref:Putative Beat-va n=1 Tax=Daphnia magna TaxID=35525 RepID=A0A164L0C2_9CRUS|nr:putative Beat-va [Daphnia magna]
MYWIASFIEKLERTRRLSDFIQGHFIVLPLRCTSHILGLFEESDTSDIRVLRHLSSTTSPAVPGNRVAVKLAKPSPNSSAAGANTRHGAFTNGSSSIARILGESYFDGNRSDLINVVCSSLLTVECPTEKRFCIEHRN